MGPRPSSPIVESRPSFRNADRVRRIRYRLRLYARHVSRSLGRVPARELVRTQFPFWMSDAPVPPLLSVELTNLCNLACGYCTNPTSRRPRGMMREATFERLVAQASDGGTFRIALCGNGEATLHPRYPDWVRRLSGAVRWVSLTSNWQRIDDEIISSSLESLRMLNVSVDGASRGDYERRRVGGRFDLLLRNLDRLNARKRSSGSRMLVNVRVMLEPRDVGREQEIVRFWRPYADVVSRQYILDFGVGEPRSFVPDLRGRCTLPFKKLDVHWNGVVNLCSYSWIQVGEPDGLVLGNIDETTVSEMWNGSIMRQYREGHRRRIEAMIPVCRGCPGRT